MASRSRLSRAILAAATAACFGAAVSGQTPDWPRFRGAAGDGMSREKGLLPEWPEGGPKLLWKLEGLGKGYSSVTIAGGRLFTMGDLPREGLQQFALAYDLQKREKLWEAKVGPPHEDGPRCTLTVDDGRVYALGTSGDLVCADAATGNVLWRKNLERDFGGRMMSGWRYSESPLVDGDKLVCTPGGKEATMIALNKKTGEPVWKCAVPAIGDRGRDGAGYSSIVVSEACGIRQYVQIFGRGAMGVQADTGKFLWGYNRVANGTANVPSPVVRDNYVFVTTAYGTGSALLKLTKTDDGEKAEEVYFVGPDAFQNHHGGVVLVGDYIYGGEGHNKGTPACLEFLTGKIVWKANPPAGGSAAVLCADGNLIFRYDSGLVCLIEASPQAFKLKGRFTPVKGGGTAWAHPVIHDGKLYLRHADALACYDVKAR